MSNECVWMIEVELKFEVDSLREMRARFQALGAVRHGESVQVDEYLNDPIRDFAKEDKALRIRSSGEGYRLTYKGPGLDSVAKARHEVEVHLESEASAKLLRSVFHQIGFKSVANVVKSRETMVVEWAGDKVEVCLDEVDEVGAFVELELVVGSSAEKDVAKQKLMSLAEQVGLCGSLQTSYLELLLRRRGDI
ncbi:MAG: class IV adenylate cyclase [Mariniblastus sp.]|nr:class IV adenylate cyclase [Mariniblastus sp.]